MSNFHIGPNGPGRCRGGEGQIRPTGCRFKGNFHGTLEECEQVIELENESFQRLQQALVDGGFSIESDAIFRNFVETEKRKAAHIRDEVYAKYYDPASDSFSLDDEAIEAEVVRLWHLNGVNPIATDRPSGAGLMDKYIKPDDRVSNNILVADDRGMWHEVYFYQARHIPTRPTADFPSVRINAWNSLYDPEKHPNGEAITKLVNAARIMERDRMYKQIHGAGLRRPFTFATAGMATAEVGFDFREHCEQGGSLFEFAEQQGIDPLEHRAILDGDSLTFYSDAGNSSIRFDKKAQSVTYTYTDVEEWLNHGPDTKECSKVVITSDGRTVEVEKNGPGFDVQRTMQSYSVEEMRELDHRFPL